MLERSDNPRQSVCFSSRIASANAKTPFLGRLKTIAYQLDIGRCSGLVGRAYACEADTLLLHQIRYSSFGLRSPPQMSAPVSSGSGVGRLQKVRNSLKLNSAPASRAEDVMSAFSVCGMSLSLFRLSPSTGSTLFLYAAPIVASGSARSRKSHARTQRKSRKMPEDLF